MRGIPWAVLLALILVSPCVGFSGFTSESDRDELGDSTSSEEVRSRGTSEDQHRLLEPSGELLFQFDNWTPAEESQLQSYASEFYPLAKVTFGAPFFNLTISVEKDETIPVVGLYDPSSDTIKMRFLNKRLFAHEALHAFRDEHMIHIGTFEEGMARALDAYITGNLTSQVSSENYVFHESYNVPGVGSRGGYLHRGGVSSLVRYDLAGYAWLKAFIENDAFFSDFNKYYFQNVTMDSSAQSNETLLKSIVESLVPEIEGLPFQLWYLKEFIFDTYPELGWVTLSFWDYPSIEVRYFERTNNSEIPLPFPLEIEVYNHTGALVSTGTVYHGDRHFYILDLAENYTGKLFSDVWRANGVADGPSRSYGMNHSMGLTGLFGVVPYLNSGSVVVRYSGTEHPVDIVNGTFIIPSLEGYSGKLEIELEGQGCRCRKSLTKGPGSYFVVLDPPGCPSLNLRGRSDTSVELSWDPVVSDDFLLYSLSVSNDTGESIVGFYYDAETANATVTGLEPSSRFSFTMRAYSTRATFHETTLNVSTLPPKPVLFVRANSTTTNSTELEWALAGFPEFSRLDLYQSVQSDSSGVVIRSYSNPNVKKIALGQLDQSRTYFFWLEVRDNQGETSVSNQVRVTCLPESVSILGAEDVTESSFSVRWTHPFYYTFQRFEFLVSYDNVTIRALSETIRDRNATAYVYRDLLPATHYHIRIRTVCDNSSESLSEVYEVMTPPTPVTLHATMSEQALTLTWSTNTDQNFSRYDVYVSFLEGQLGTLVASVDNRFANSMILTNLTRGPDYFLTVAVISSHGKVSYSDQAVVPFETQTDYSLLVIITVSMIVIALLFAAIRYGQTRRVRP